MREVRRKRGGERWRNKREEERVKDGPRLEMVRDYRKLFDQFG